MVYAKVVNVEFHHVDVIPRKDKLFLYLINNY